MPGHPQEYCGQSLAQLLDSAEQKETTILEDGDIHTPDEHVKLLLLHSSPFIPLTLPLLSLHTLTHTHTHTHTQNAGPAVESIASTDLAVKGGRGGGGEAGGRGGGGEAGGRGGGVQKKTWEKQRKKKKGKQAPAKKKTIPAKKKKKMGEKEKVCKDVD